MQRNQTILYAVVPLVAAAALLVPAQSARAASLQVSPVTVEVVAPGAASTLKLRNEGGTAINVQIRVFRWTQTNGEEKLEPTSDVAASPPLAKLAPKMNYTVRVVRVSKAPVAKEEGYRILVDELPDRSTQHVGTVNLVLRYSIPVFFLPPHGAPPKLAWSIDQRGNRIAAAVTNSGDRHVRIALLRLRDANGAVVTFGNGLTGYVLAGSSMHWLAPAGSKHLSTAKPIAVSAQGNLGPINDTAVAKP